MSNTLDTTAPSPRVNFGLLPQFVGKRVTLVGRVEGIEGNTLRLKTSDDGLVTVNLQGIAPQVRLAAGGGWARAQWLGPVVVLLLLLLAAVMPQVMGVVNSPLATKPTAPPLSLLTRLRCWR